MTVEEWPLARVLDAAPAWGGATWAETVDSALGDPEDMVRISLLAAELGRRGQFREPVRLYRDETGLGVGNGMHRILTHILTGHDQIQVTFDEPPVSTGQFWRATLDIPEEHFEQAFALTEAVSMPADADTWLETIGAGAYGISLHIDLYSSAPIPTSSIAHLIADWYTTRDIALRAGQVHVEHMDWNLDDQP